MFLSWIIELPLISSSMTWFIVYSGDFNKTSVAPSEIVISCILIRYHLICFHSEGFAFLMQDNYVKKHPVWFIYIFLTLFFSIWRQFFAFPLCAVDHQLALLLLTIKMKESGCQVFFKELKKSHILRFFSVLFLENVGTSYRLALSLYSLYGSMSACPIPWTAVKAWGWSDCIIS